MPFNQPQLVVYATISFAALSTSKMEEVAPEEVSESIHVLFVMFDQPDTAINKKPQVSLQKWEAHYSATLQVYSVPGGDTTKPIANR